MQKQVSEEQARIERLTETFLYNLGYEYVNHLCEEYDRQGKEQENIQVPESLNQWFEQFSKEYEKQKKKDGRAAKLKMIGKRAAVLFLVTAATVSAVTLSVEAFRIRLFNMLIETNRRFSEIRFEEKDLTGRPEGLPDGWVNYYPTYVPEGYRIETVVDTDNTKYLRFSNEEGEQIGFFQSNFLGGFQIDTEDAVVTELEINGYEGIASEKEDVAILIWHNGTNSFFLSGTVDLSELIKMAESITKIK